MSEKSIKVLLALVEKHLGTSWAAVSEWLRDQNSIDEIERRLLAYDFNGVVAEVEAAARRFAAETHSQFVRSGQETAKWLDGKLSDRLVRFDAVGERAVRAARRNELELVYGLSDENRKIVNGIIADGQRAGLNPRTIARDIRGSIGLNAQQEKAVRNRRIALESGEFGQRTEQQIDRAVERYRQQKLRERAEVIARTEGTKNVHAGLQEAFTQAIDRGDIEADQLVREWIAGPRTANAREQHQALDGKQVKFGEPFVAADGTRLMWPGSGPPEHAANCRCTVATTIAS